MENNQGITQEKGFALRSENVPQLKNDSVMPVPQPTIVKTNKPLSFQDYLERSFGYQNVPLNVMVYNPSKQQVFRKGQSFLANIDDLNFNLTYQRDLEPKQLDIYVAQGKESGFENGWNYITFHKPSIIKDKLTGNFNIGDGNHTTNLMKKIYTENGISTIVNGKKGIYILYFNLNKTPLSPEFIQFCGNKFAKKIKHRLTKLHIFQVF